MQIGFRIGKTARGNYVREDVIDNDGKVGCRTAYTSFPNLVRGLCRLASNGDSFMQCPIEFRRMKGSRRYELNRQERATLRELSPILADTSDGGTILL
jgi:hypothetical protein